MNAHPYYWVLTHLFGLNDRQIRHETGISHTTLSRLAQGYDPKPPQLKVLKAFITRLRDHAGRTCPAPSPKDPEELRAFMRSFWAVVNYYLDVLTPVDLTQRRSTELTRLILANLGTNGERRQAVIASLHRDYSSTSIRRAARRLGVVEETRGGHVWWIPPRMDIRPKLTLPPPKFKKAETPRMVDLHNKLTIMLGRAPNAQLDSREIFARLEPFKFGRATIYKAARDLCLIMETTGFGKEKRSVWGLPHLKEP